MIMNSANKCQTTLKALAQGGTLFTRGGQYSQGPRQYSWGDIIHSDNRTVPFCSSTICRIMTVWYYAIYPTKAHVCNVTKPPSMQELVSCSKPSIVWQEDPPLTKTMWDQVLIIETRLSTEQPLLTGGTYAPINGMPHLAHLGADVGERRGICHRNLPREVGT